MQIDSPPTDGQGVGFFSNSGSPLRCDIRYSEVSGVGRREEHGEGDRRQATGFRGKE